MKPAVAIWWTPGPVAEPVSARARARDMSAVPAEWRRGLRGRFLEDVVRQSRAQVHWHTQTSAQGWRFNLAAGRHLSLTDSGSCLMIAVGRGVPLGIDAERIRPVDDALATLRGLGLEHLARRLGRMAPAARNTAFIHIWTAFEALLKLERLPWATAAARFAGLQDKWHFGIDGVARFAGQERVGVVFQTVGQIPDILLTVATPLSCTIDVSPWHCGIGDMRGEKPAAAVAGELRCSEKRL